MKTAFLRTCLLGIGSFLTLATTRSITPPTPPRYYEMRTYYPMPGKYEAIIDRFRRYTTKLFEKHGMQNIGYWTPTDPTRRELTYILAYPNRAARDSSWKAFRDDPDWKAVVKKTEADGKLVERVVSQFMIETDLTVFPETKPADPPRTFELRTYTASPGRMPNLLARFRNHTRKLFRKHDMEGIGYWLTEGSDTEAPKLVYFLAHPSEAEGKRNLEAFRADKRWVKAKAESETNGPLTAKVESLYLKPTDYSPMR
jgi:hypothetical protein